MTNARSYRIMPTTVTKTVIMTRVRSKLKVQNSRTFQGPKLHFSSTKIIDKKPYLRCGYSKLRPQCDTEVYCTVLTNTVMIKAKFQNLQDLNSRTFQVLSSTLSVFKQFQGPWSFYSKFKHFQGFLKHAMNPVWRQRSSNLAVCSALLPLVPSSPPLCRRPTASSVDDSDVSSPSRLVSRWCGSAPTGLSGALFSARHASSCTLVTRKSATASDCQCWVWVTDGE